MSLRRTPSKANSGGSGSQEDSTVSVFGSSNETISASSSGASETNPAFAYRLDIAKQHHDARRLTEARQALEAARLEVQSPKEMLQALDLLGFVEMRDRNWEHAEKIWEKILEMQVILDSKHEIWVVTAGRLLVCLRNQHKWAEAREITCKLIERTKTVFGTISDELADLLDNQGRAMAMGHAFDDAIWCFSESLKIRREINASDPTHASLALSAIPLARAYRRGKMDLVQAREAYLVALTCWNRKSIEQIMQETPSCTVAARLLVLKNEVRYEMKLCEEELASCA
jgi:tetratricopeptide (TPR) repeat protein